MYAENSDFGPNDISPTGCAGLMQICGETAKPEYIKVQCAQKGGPFQCNKNTCAMGRADAPDDDVFWCDQCLQSSPDCVTDERFIPEKNIYAGVLTLQSKRKSIQNYCPDDRCVVAAYNVGQAVIKKAAEKAGIPATWEKS